MPRLQGEEIYFRNPMVPYKEYKRIIYEPGRVTRIKLNRPRYMNAQSHAMFGELEDAFDHSSDNPECHVIVLSGEGRCYSGGDDAMGLTPESAPCLVTDETPEELIKRLGSERAVWHQYNIEHDYYIHYWFHQKLPRTPMPTVSMVHGWCIYGGMHTATAMDVVFASEDALFKGGGGGGRHMSAMGPHKALEIAYENRFITAREAMELGIVNRVFPNREILEKETLAFAERVANEVPATLRRTKQSVLQTLDCMGYRAAYDVNMLPSADMWRQEAIGGHAMRYEGRGMARSPVGLYNLAAKLISEGKEVPEHVRAALERAAKRDDRGAWQRAVHQEWRESERLKRADTDASKWDERMAKEGIIDIKERIKEQLASLKK